MKAKKSPRKQTSEAPVRAQKSDLEVIQENLPTEAELSWEAATLKRAAQGLPVSSFEDSGG